MTTKRHDTTMARWAFLALTPALALTGCSDDGAPELETETLADTGSETGDASDSTTGESGKSTDDAEATSSDVTGDGTTSDDTTGSTGGSDTGSTGDTGASTDSGSGDSSGSSGSTGSTGGMAMLEIEGTYTDNFGGMHEITAQAWVNSGEGYELRFDIETIDNDADFLIAQNGEINGNTAGLYSRFSWFTDDDGQLWYCQAPFDAESADAAEAAAPPDPSTPSEGGCGIGPWSALDPIED